jgi:hypothetical protein
MSDKVEIGETSAGGFLGSVTQQGHRGDELILCDVSTARYRWGNAI